MKLWLLMLSVALPSVAHSPVLGQSAPETLVFSVDHQGTPLTSFTLTLQSDGSAVYQASYPAEQPKYSPYAVPAGSLPSVNITLKTRLSQAGTAALFEHARAANGFSGGCNSKARNIANTGKKTLTYTAAGVPATCTFNYPDDRNVVYLANTFQAIGYTLDEGRTLESRHRYDRLALDPETDHLVSAVKRGDAAELGTIAPILQTLVDDPQVLERVRKRAANLLAEAARNQ